jgi:hypothetical protein
MFDKETSNVVKLNDSFTFEKEIYLDRFLLENKQEAIQINNKIVELRAKVLEYPHLIFKLTLQTESLEKISNYLNSQLDIIKVLTLGTTFLENQLNSSSTGSFDPTHVGPKGNVSEAVKVLRDYTQVLETQNAQIKENIIHIQVNHTFLLTPLERT